MLFLKTKSSGFTVKVQLLTSQNTSNSNVSLTFILHSAVLMMLQGETMSDAPGQMREQEYVGLLIRITDECCTVVHQVQQMLQQRQKQFFDKQLRSRQRDNLQKLLLRYVRVNACTYV